MRNILLGLVTLVATLALACGQDASDCNSVCAAVFPTGTSALDPDSPASSCATSCGSDQTVATTNGHGADFQALLTCIGNAGSFASECAPLACGLTHEFGAPSGCSSDAGER